MTDTEYKSCFDFNCEDKAELDRMNKNVNNPANLVLQPMMYYEPSCREYCPYTKRCRELWKGK